MEHKGTLYINSLDEIKTLKKGELYTFDCRRCGTVVVRQKWLGKAQQLKRLMCKSCNRKQTNLELYGDENYSNVEKTKATNLAKYGVEFPLERKDIFQKTVDTVKSKYNTDNVLRLKEFRDKAKETKKRLYGDEYYTNLDKMRETNKKKYGVEYIGNSKVVRDKIEATNIRKYGVKSTLSTKDVQEKRDKTMKAKYGTSTTLQSPILKAKVEATNEAKYGSISPFGSKEVQEKAKQTLKDRYGVDHPSQHEEFLKRSLKTLTDRYGRVFNNSRYLYSGERFDSSWELALWIYAKDHGENIERVEEPFEYYVGGKKHLYFPDFKYKGQLVEVKGDQFIGNETMINPFDISQNDIYDAKYKCIVDNGVKILYYEDMIPYINYCRTKYAYKTWYHMYAIQYMWLQWLYNYSFMHDFTPFSTNVFEREGMEFVDCE